MTQTSHVTQHSEKTWPALHIGEFTLSVPIIQGGMGVGISLSNLAAAVATAGGIGVIATAMIGIGEPDIQTNSTHANVNALTREIRLARSKTTGVLGVNTMVATTDFEALAQAAIEENIDVIFAGAGLPLSLPKFLKSDSHTKLVPIVSSGRAATILCKKWLSGFNYQPDAFVVEGPMAGGHLGFERDQINDPAYALEVIVPQVLDAVKPFEDRSGKAIPIIAAGGIYTGADIYKFLQMGAAGVQMGTRFVATHECDADIAFKQAYINATRDDLTIIKSPIGLPGRAIRNTFLRDVEAGKEMFEMCLFDCCKPCNPRTAPYCIAAALDNARHGNLAGGFAFAGANAYRVTDIVSVNELIASLQQEYADVAGKNMTEDMMT